MRFLEYFRPRLVAPTVFDIDLDGLWRRGIRGLILDLDNTLVAWGSDLVSDRLLAWVSEARVRGFRLCLSANARARRVKQMAGRLNVPGIANAGKPRRRAFRRALQIMGTRPGETAVVGDQLFTDILGGNRLGLFTVLVAPLAPRDFVWTRLVRHPERLVLRALGLGRPVPRESTGTPPARPC